MQTVAATPCNMVARHEQARSCVNHRGGVAMIQRRCDSHRLLDIFHFWWEVGRAAHVHPADRAVMSRVRHRFDLRSLPGCFAGPLRTAPVVLLYLSPGSSKKDRIEAKSKAGRARYARMRTGRMPLPGPRDHRSAWQWWKSRTKHFGAWEDLRSKVAVLNIGAYHSKTFADAPLLAALPSSRMSLQWAQRVLFPQAIAGKRVVVCLRAARFWGLAEGHRYGRALFAPPVTRSGYMKKSPMRDKVIRAVRKMISRS